MRVASVDLLRNPATLTGLSCRRVGPVKRYDSDVLILWFVACPQHAELTSPLGEAALPIIPIRCLAF